MEMGRDDWVASVDVIKEIYSKYLDNQKSPTAIEFINHIGRDIPTMFILTSIQQLTP